MRISTFFYVLRQGLRNIFRNKWYSLASVATIATCLFLFGVFYSILINFSNIIHNAEKDVSIVVFFEQGISDAKIKLIGDEIKNRKDEVADVKYVSAEDAWAEFSKDYVGTKEEVDATFPNGDNPLADSANYQVFLKDVSKQGELVAYIQSLDGVRQVQRSELVANTLSGVNSLVGYVSLAIIGLLLIVSIFLISNTVTSGISIRKEEIGIMKYIGATDFFVRSPFIIEGIIIGAIGSVLPLGVIYYVYSNITAFIASKFAVLSSLLAFIDVSEIFKTLMPLTIIIGVGIGFIGSYTTVKRHIHV